LTAVDVWCPIMDQSMCKTTSSVEVIRCLTSVQRASTLTITRGLRTSPTDVLDACAYTLPAPLIINKWQHRALIRLATLPSDHPLHRVVTRKNAGKTKRHKSPISSLLVAYNYDTKKVKKIPTTARDPTLKGTLPFITHMAPDREDSIEEAANATEEVIVFTDGSAINGKVGVAATLTRQGNPLRTLHLHLGKEKHHTIHEAELAGILLTMHLISTEKHGHTTFVIAVDNQAAIQVFHSELRNLASGTRENANLAKSLKSAQICKIYSYLLR
jgi:hypothetical protein